MKKNKKYNTHSQHQVTYKMCAFLRNCGHWRVIADIDASIADIDASIADIDAGAPTLPSCSQVEACKTVCFLL